MLNGYTKFHDLKRNVYAYYYSFQYQFSLYSNCYDKVLLPTSFDGVNIIRGKIRFAVVCVNSSSSNVFFFWFHIYIVHFQCFMLLIYEKQICIGPSICDLRLWYTL